MKQYLNCNELINFQLLYNTFELIELTRKLCFIYCYVLLCFTVIISYLILSRVVLIAHSVLFPFLYEANDFC